MLTYVARRLLIAVPTLLFISAVIFLTTPQVRIMTAQILNEVDSARYGNAYAYCVILILIVLAAIALLSLVVGSTTKAERMPAVDVAASR